jgi:hypothetical protein
MPAWVARLAPQRHYCPGDPGAVRHTQQPGAFSWTHQTRVQNTMETVNYQSPKRVILQLQRLALRNTAPQRPVNRDGGRCDRLHRWQGIHAARSPRLLHADGHTITLFVSVGSAEGKKAVRRLRMPPLECRIRLAEVLVTSFAVVAGDGFPQGPGALGPR